MLMTAPRHAPMEMTQDDCRFVITQGGLNDNAAAGIARAMADSSSSSRHKHLTMGAGGYDGMSFADIAGIAQTTRFEIGARRHQLDSIYNNDNQLLFELDMIDAAGAMLPEMADTIKAILRQDQEATLSPEYREQAISVLSDVKILDQVKDGRLELPAAEILDIVERLGDNIKAMDKAEILPPKLQDITLTTMRDVAVKMDVPEITQAVAHVEQHFSNEGRLEQTIELLKTTLQEILISPEKIDDLDEDTKAAIQEILETLEAREEGATLAPETLEKLDIISDKVDIKIPVVAAIASAPTLKALVAKVTQHNFEVTMAKKFPSAPSVAKQMITAVAAMGRTVQKMPANSPQVEPLRYAVKTMTQAPFRVESIAAMQVASQAIQMAAPDVATPVSIAAPVAQTPDISTPDIAPVMDNVMATQYVVTAQETGQSVPEIVEKVEAFVKPDRIDPVNPDPVNPDPVNPDPDNPDPVNPDPDNPDPDNPDPVNPDPDNPDPVNPDPDNPDPDNPDPDNPDPDNPDPDNPDPDNPDPDNLDPDNLDPEKVEPKRDAPDDTPTGTPPVHVPQALLDELNQSDLGEWGRQVEAMENKKPGFLSVLKKTFGGCADCVTKTCGSCGFNLLKIPLKAAGSAFNTIAGNKIPEIKKENSISLVPK